MDQMAVDIDQAGAVLTFMDDMIVPDFLEQGAWLGKQGEAP